MIKIMWILLCADLLQMCPQQHRCPVNDACVWWYKTFPQTALCDRQPPLIQMILPLLLLLASLLQQYGSEAESSLVSKFNPPSVKEQNGKFLVLFIL